MQDVEQITGQALYCAGLLRKGESLSGNVVFKDLVLKCLTPSGTGAPVNWRKLFKDFPEFIDRLEDEIKAMEDIGGFFQSRADTDKGSSSTDHSGITRYSGKLAAGMEPVPGYRLEEKLGEGGFGEVYRAIGPGGFPVALKFVGLKEKAKAFELRSLDLLKSLRHPNLLVTFGSWETENNLVIAMELADCSLHDVFKKYQSRNSSGIPFDELINYMEGASEGIDYLNSYQSPFGGDSKKVAIQHRDIKPQNLLIVGGKAKIGDFGLIRKLETNETSHTGMMTSAFAAPEFFEGKTSNNSDQYSLAVSYCLLRGGSLPFSGSIVQILKGHNSPNLTMLPEIEKKIVEKALSKNPTARWQNCKSFIDALRSQALFSKANKNLVVTALSNKVIEKNNTKNLFQNSQSNIILKNFLKKNQSYFKKSILNAYKIFFIIAISIFLFLILVFTILKPLKKNYGYDVVWERINDNQKTVLPNEGILKNLAKKDIEIINSFSTLKELFSENAIWADPILKYKFIVLHIDADKFIAKLEIDSEIIGFVKGRIQNNSFYWERIDVSMIKGAPILPMKGVLEKDDLGFLIKLNISGSNRPEILLRNIKGENDFQIDRSKNNSDFTYYITNKDKEIIELVKELKNSFAINSVWIDPASNHKISILTVDSYNFTAKFQVGNDVIRIVKGEIQNNFIFWHSRNDEILKGSRGADFQGTLEKDLDGFFIILKIPGSIRPAIKLRKI